MKGMRKLFRKKSEGKGSRKREYTMEKLPD
jgi:hypothetical protein